MFLSPIWFFALAALGIPVAIHLWNIRPGRTLKVGSISLISEASKSIRRSFKLLDILLLILRCLLLALLAVFLARPVWRNNAPAKQAKGWVLIPYANFNETYQHFKPGIDSLLTVGYELHFFQKDFAKPDLKKTPITQLVPDSIKDDSSLNYWELINLVGSRVPAGLPVYVFTPNSAQHFRGQKPATALPLKWTTYTQKDSTAHFISGAWLNRDGDIILSEGTSSPSGTVYITRVIKRGVDMQTEVTVNNGKSYIHLKDARQEAVVVDTSILRIAIYAGENTLDAKYMKAALDAAVSFTGRKAVVKTYNEPSSIPSAQTWLFWLSTKQINSALMNSAANVFRYQAGKPLDVSTKIYPGEVKITRLITQKQTGEAVWTDGYGNGVLSRVKHGKTTLYTFGSRFNPSWSDLVWSDAFPKQILALLTGDNHSVPAKYDRRILSNQQIQLDSISSNSAPLSLAKEKPVDISRYFWLALVVVFLAERIVAFKTKQTRNG